MNKIFDQYYKIILRLATNFHHELNKSRYVIFVYLD